MGRGDASRHEAEGVRHEDPAPPILPSEARTVGTAGETTHLGRGWTRSGTRPGTGPPLTRASNTREHRSLSGRHLQHLQVFT
jgi:hypothetical protein